MSSMSEHLLALGRFIRAYRLGIGALVVLNALIWVAAERTYGPHLNVQQHQADPVIRTAETLLWSRSSMMACGGIPATQIC